MQLQAQFENQRYCGRKRHQFGVDLSSRMFIDYVLETEVEEDNSAVERNCSPVTGLHDPAAFTDIAGLRALDGCKDSIIFLS